MVHLLPERWAERKSSIIIIKNIERELMHFQLKMQSLCRSIILVMIKKWQLTFENLERVIILAWN
ncbi:MAG: hypothetical protein COW00_13670 [Bdellovibrio sp. CG12_big_fil_rev_8_21_14_0_65_39_13]|nr:MAG: hypothetical protein COW78_07095 [Bdellovibrio sp. CG22_combo_CG10-13_8_21_14_all_39_27]PIQ58663.1 MAG: hypothetical protein COW00_13670 [Bdellovibrio sp. CG12_big_fil_rev_8_21_14_0_65_39_13]PIR33038.1 MAG: hypothetical protein COV37_18265 [Bdellovibrio sp. CG11_big_fil_rev_8_21_14_0_20_39_38]